MEKEKKKTSNGPEEGYCLQRTRKRLVAGLLGAALFLFVGVCVWAYLIFELLAYRSGWEVMDYLKLVLGVVIGLGSIIATVYEGYTGVRDALFPAQSSLAKSIRSQLRYPDEAPGVRELFAMVDRDIQENGQWFDKVAVGKEWVLGDDVTAISRIRAVFGRDEMARGAGNKRHRVVELHILDDRQQEHMTSLNNANELEPLLSCLKLRAPAALFLPYKQYYDYKNKSEDEWAHLNREFRLRESKLESNTTRTEDTLTQPQNMVLTREDGSVTSRLSPELLRQTLLECLRAGGMRYFFLLPSQPIEVDGYTLYELQCITTFEEEIEHSSDNDLMAFGTVLLILKILPQQPDGELKQGFVLETDFEQGEEILCAWLRGDRPDLRGWNLVPLRMMHDAQSQQKQQEPNRLSLTYRSGTTRNYSRFTRRDVELAGEGFVSGKYSNVVLSMGAEYIYIQSGSKEDGRAIVQASRLDKDELRLFEIKCRDRQAQEWLLEVADRRFAPDFSQWKDITKRIQKEINRLEKAKK